MTNIDQLLRRAQSERAKLSKLERQTENQKKAVSQAQDELAKALSGEQSQPAPVEPVQEPAQV